MLEALTYTFFQKAMFAGLLISLISWVLWSLVILRQEPNITHSMANILFLWIVVSFFFSGNYYVFWILFAILWVVILASIERYTPASRVSSKEIISQLGLAWGIFGIGMLGNIQIDIFNFLFWSILFVESIDIYLLIWMLIIWIVLWLLFWKKFVSVVLSREIAQSQGLKVHIYELWYLFYLAVFIAVSLKIFWVLLLGAFLVLPGNIGKILSPSLKWVFIISTIVALIAVCVWLFTSYYLDTSAWATIVLILGIIFLISSFFRRNK